MIYYIRYRNNIPYPINTPRYLNKLILSNTSCYMKITTLNLLLLSSVGLPALLFSSCGTKASQVGGGDPVQEYSVLTLTARPATSNTDYPASIQGQQDIEIRPKVDGFVEKIYVDEGSVVKKGQLLFKLSAPQYEQDVRTAEAGINTAQADVNTAQLAVNKVKPLVEKEIISPEYVANKIGRIGPGQSRAGQCADQPRLYHHNQPGERSSRFAAI